MGPCSAGTISGRETMRARPLVSLAMLSALAALLMRFVQFPLLPAAPYLKFDPSEVPTLLAGLVYGPVAGVAVALLKNALYVLLFGSATGWVGPFSNFAAVSLFVAPAAWLYRRDPSLVGLVKGVVVGALARVLGMLPVLAFVVLPVFLGYSPTDSTVLQRQVSPLLARVFIPFNALASLINGALILWLVAAIRTRIPILSGQNVSRVLR